MFKSIVRDKTVAKVFIVDLLHFIFTILIQELIPIYQGRSEKW